MPVPLCVNMFSDILLLFQANAKILYVKIRRYKIPGASKQQMKEHAYFMIVNQYLIELREYEVRQPIWLFNKYTHIHMSPSISA